MFDMAQVIQQCGGSVHPQTLQAVITTESSGNPFAIGVVGEPGLAKQPQTLEEAVGTAERLEKEGRNFSVGWAQINRYNIPKYGLTYRTAFDVCTNINVSAQILTDCYTRAVRRATPDVDPLHAALSCYYSGNFTRGFKADDSQGRSYVDRVISHAAAMVMPGYRSTKKAPPPASSAMPPLPTPLKRPPGTMQESQRPMTPAPSTEGVGDAFGEAIPDAFTAPQQQARRLPQTRASIPSTASALQTLEARLLSSTNSKN
ncbi:lytic transglycosylase domain-containing protein [Achromobacter ruhlandii]|uniref:lytic transglycosylase domain-containing protein n=1 Tax=Achromobacter ruhlandii TaxID=72557 RepID=UPI003B9EBD18